LNVFCLTGREPDHSSLSSVNDGYSRRGHESNTESNEMSKVIVEAIVGAIDM
jgi:hypothetical protein